MSLDNVRRLMVRLREDDALRRALNRADGPVGRDAVLAEHGLSFTDADFDAAESALHAKVTTADEADEFSDFRNWWEMLRRT